MELARAKPAMPVSVQEVNDEADDEPYGEANPGLPGQSADPRDREAEAAGRLLGNRDSNDQIETDQDPEDRSQRNERRAERARPVRVSPPQDHDPDADEDEGE